jgi:hypothetical protein
LAGQKETPSFIFIHFGKKNIFKHGMINNAAFPAKLNTNYKRSNIFSSSRRIYRMEEQFQEHRLSCDLQRIFVFTLPVKMV